MSAAIDANVLLYASDESSKRHTLARALLADLAAGPDLVYLFWPVAMAYLRIATHQSIFERPLTPEVAVGNVADLVARPHVRTPGEGERYWDLFRAAVEHDVIRGNLVTDAHIATLVRLHGVTAIWTAGRDFRRFPGNTYGTRTGRERRPPRCSRPAATCAGW